MAALSICKDVSAGKRKIGPPSAFLRLEDEALNALECCSRLDRYAGYSWVGDSLKRLIESLSERVHALYEEVERSVLAETRNETVQEWMVPMIDARLSSSAAYQATRLVLEFARDAERTNASLLFESD